MCALVSRSRRTSSQNVWRNHPPIRSSADIVCAARTRTCIDAFTPLRYCAFTHACSAQRAHMSSCLYGTARCEAPPGGTACHGTARLGAMQHGMGHIFQRLCLHTLLHANAHDFTPLRLYTHMHACARAHACTHTQIHDRRTRKSQMMENVNYYEYQSLLLLLMRNGL